MLFYGFLQRKKDSFIKLMAKKVYVNVTRPVLTIGLAHLRMGKTSHPCTRYKFLCLKKTKRCGALKWNALIYETMRLNIEHEVECRQRIRSKTNSQYAWINREPILSELDFSMQEQKTYSANIAKTNVVWYILANKHEKRMLKSFQDAIVCLLSH